MNYGGHPLVTLRTAIENHPFIVDLAMKGGDFPGRYVNVYQRLCQLGLSENRVNLPNYSHFS